MTGNKKAAPVGRQLFPVKRCEAYLVDFLSILVSVLVVVDFIFPLSIPPAGAMLEELLMLEELMCDVSPAAGVAAMCDVSAIGAAGVIEAEESVLVSVVDEESLPQEAANIPRARAKAPNFTNFMMSLFYV